MKKKIESEPNLIKDMNTGVVLSTPGGLDAARIAKAKALQKQEDSDMIRTLIQEIESLKNRVLILESSMQQ